MLEFYFSYRGVLKRLRDGALGTEMDRIAGYFSRSVEPDCAVQPFCCSTLRFKADRRSHRR